MASVDAASAFAMGVQALDAGDLRAAERIFGGIVAADPGAHDAWNALSVVAARGGEPEVAAMRAQQALQLSRRNPLYLNNLGVAKGELGEFGEAEGAFRRALKIEPLYTEALFNLGKVLHKQGRLADSVAAYRRAYSMQPEFPGLRVSLAHLHRVSGQPERALEIMQETPGGIDKHSALLHAECLAAVHGPQTAVDWMQDTLRREPSWRALRWQLGLHHLASGHWRKGWKEYFQRDEEGTAPPVAPLPANLAGRKVFLRHDQGLGDNLFFLRFAPALRERGAEVHFLCPSALRALLQPLPLFKRLFDAESAVDEVVYDHRLLVSDLPAALEAESTPPSVPLLVDRDAAERMSERLRALGQPPYLGLTWRAGTDTLRGREFGVAQNVLSKEVPLERLAAAVRGWRGTLLCLQRKPYPDEIEKISAAAGARVHDFSAANGDLQEMLALLSLLNDYVTVSNTNVHLRASLGKHAKVIVPYPAEWRWMFEGGESPWFPGFALYRQPASHDWSAPLGRLREDLFR